MNTAATRVTATEEYKPWQPVDDWTLLQGRDVEIHDHEGIVDQGLVEAVTADGTILWLCQDGAHTRRIIQKTPGTHIRAR